MLFALDFTLYLFQLFLWEVFVFGLRVTFSLWDLIIWIDLSSNFYFWIVTSMQSLSSQPLIKLQLGKSLTQNHSHLFPFLGSERKLIVSKRIIVKPIRWLHRIGERDIHTSIENGSCRCCLLAWYSEDAWIVSKVWSHVSENARKLSAQFIVGMLDIKIWPIHEHILFNWVTMQINIKA